MRFLMETAILVFSRYFAIETKLNDTHNTILKTSHIEHYYMSYVGLKIALSTSWKTNAMDWQCKFFNDSHLQQQKC